MGDAKKQKTADISKPVSSQDPGESCGVNHWPRLSDEVVLHILRLLPRKELVKSSLIDRRFRTLSRDDSLWTELTLDYVDIKQNAGSCRKLVDRCKKLASLKIINNKTNSWEKLNIMTVVVRAKDSLKSLEVDDRMREWTPAAMAKLGRLQNLTSLSMAFDSEPYKVNSYEGANMLEELANLDQLEELQLWLSHMYNTGYINGNSLPVMKKVFQQLKKLKKVEIHTPDYDDSLGVALAENNPNLMVLRLKNVFSFSHGFHKHFTDNGIERMVSSAKNLKHLEIGWAPQVTKDLIDRLRKEHPNLDLDVRI